MTKKTLLLTMAALLCSTAAMAEENQEAEKAYCKYVTEQAEAQRDLLRTPSAIAGPTQPSAGTPPQMVFGLTGSVANNLKAPLVMSAARAQCKLFAAQTEAQQVLYFAEPRMEKDALVHRLELVQQGSEQLDKMIQQEEKMVEAKNVTRQALYYLQSARARLDMRRTSALTTLLPEIPETTKVPLRTLLNEKQKAEEASQKAAAKLAAANGWDLVLTGGGRRQLGDYNFNNTVSDFGGFGEASLTYNFGRHAANQHLNRSVSAYLDLKNNQFEDVARQSVVLKKQVEDTLALLRPQLAALLEHDNDIESSLQSIAGLETSNSQAFKNQLLADRVVLRVDIGDIQFRLDWLESYLRENF
jgi:hypothetical protein